MPIVVLDPGHGGNDPGAQGNGIIEKNLALQIALQVRNHLMKRFQVDVRLTRENDLFIALSERAAIANRIGADYFVALHHNAAGGKGFETFVYPGTRTSQTGQMQDRLHQKIMAYLKPHRVLDRGKKTANFAVLRETQMPAILIENLFVDDPSDASLLKNPTFINGLSESIAQGIAEAMELSAMIQPSPAPNPNWKLEAVEWLFKEGLLTNEEWKKALEQPLPLWAQAIVLKKLYEKTKP